MDGRYPSRLTPQGVPLYRPALNLTLAADHGLWGLAPAGYQASNLFWYACCALALFALARRASGGAALASLLALWIFLLHPAQIEVLPVPPRRAETLCGLFMALALAFQFPAGERARRWFPSASVLATVAALLSKEAAFVLPAAVFVAAWVHAARTDGSTGSAGRALRATVPHLVAVVAMVLVRAATVGLGGGGSVLRDLVVQAPLAVWGMLNGILFPGGGIAWGWPLVVWLVAMGAVFAISKKAGVSGAPSEPGLADMMGMGLVGACWAGAVCAIYAAAGSVQPWYLLIPVAGWSLVAAAAIGPMFRVASRGTGALRAAAWFALAASAVFLVLHLRHSPVLHRYPEPLQATALADEFLAAPPLPLWVAPGATPPTMRGAAVLSDYSVQAWADLTFPDRRIRVLTPGVPAHPGPDEIVLAIVSASSVPSGAP
jgi:hypothetical protein